MCLNTITKTYDPPRAREVRAYGVFKVPVVKRGGAWCVAKKTREIKTVGQDAAVVLDRWEKAEEPPFYGTLSTTGNEWPTRYYPAGFHKFTGKSAMRSKHWAVSNVPWVGDELFTASSVLYVFIPVTLRGVTTTGTEKDCRVYVAQEMRVTRADVEAAVAAANETLARRKAKRGRK